MDGTGTAAAPPQFEHAITLARLAGAVVVVFITPFMPTLGPAAVGLLAGMLVLAAVTLHLLSTRVRRARDGDRLSWAAFGFDALTVLFAILLLTPDPSWPIVPLMAVLLIITTTFRLGTRGALLSTTLMMAGVVAIAIWRERALGLAAPVPYVAFDLIMYCLTAAIVTSMLREVGVLRRERLELIVRAADADALRAGEIERATLLQHERQARTAAELAVIQHDAVQRISDIVLRHAPADELLPETLRTLGHVVGARAAAILALEGQGLVARAVVGFDHPPRAPIAPRGDLRRALSAGDALTVGDDSVVALDAQTSSYVVSRVLVPVPRSAPTTVLYLGFDRVQQLAPDDRTLLRRIAERLAIALDRMDRIADEQRARLAASSAAARAQLVVDAADAMLGGGELGARLTRVARLFVPALADRCTIDLVRLGDSLERVAVAAPTPEDESELWMVAHRYPHRPGHSALWRVIERGRPLLHEHVGPEELRDLAQGPEHLRLFIERDVRSWAAAPIVHEGTVLGTVQLIVLGPGRALTRESLDTAVAVAARTAPFVARAGFTMG